MAREPKAISENPAALDTPSPAVAPADWMAGSLEALRTWTSGWLAVFQATVGMMEDLQRQCVQTATEWEETLALGAREVESAHDVNHLLAAPAIMFNRSVEAAVHHAVNAGQRLVDAEMASFEALRRQAIAFGPVASMGD